MNAKKTSKKTSRTRVALWIIVVILSLILIAALLVLWAFSYDETAANATEPTLAPTVVTESTAPIETTAPFVEEVELETVAPTTMNLGKGLEITDLGKYTGVYMEDGSDEVVSGVLMMVVKNNGDEAVQYAEITVPTTNGDAFFTLSTLPAGESIVLLEQNRMVWSAEETYETATADNVAFFTEELSLQEELLQIQVLDGAINVINISEADISGDIVIYYKNAAEDLYYGGITYRVRIEGGMKTGEIKQIMASHFSDTGSKIMFITVS